LLKTTNKEKCPACAGHFLCCGTDGNRQPAQGKPFLIAVSVNLAAFSENGKAAKRRVCVGIGLPAADTAIILAAVLDKER